MHPQLREFRPALRPNYSMRYIRFPAAAAAQLPMYISITSLGGFWDGVNQERSSGDYATYCSSREGISRDLGWAWITGSLVGLRSRLGMSGLGSDPWLSMISLVYGTCGFDIYSLLSKSTNCSLFLRIEDLDLSAVSPHPIA